MSTVFLPISKFPFLGQITDMITEVYARIKSRLDKVGLSESRAAKDAGLSADAIRNVRRAIEAGNLNVNFNTRTINALAPVLKTSTMWLLEGIGAEEFEDALTQIPGQRLKSNASFPPRYQSFPSDNSIPVLGQTVGGPNGRFILNGTEVGRVFMPPNLEGVEGAYAVRVYGTSMEPRYFAGQTVWLNPHEPVRQGDDVVVQIITDEENGRESYIKRFVSRSSRSRASINITLRKAKNTT